MIICFLEDLTHYGNTTPSFQEGKLLLYYYHYYHGVSLFLFCGGISMYAQPHRYKGDMIAQKKRPYYNNDNNDNNNILIYLSNLCYTTL